MCKSAAEGGQRCASHAKKALTTAQAALREARERTQYAAKSLNDSDENTPIAARSRREQYLADARNEEAKARREYRDALADYASTSEGQEYVDAELARDDITVGRRGALTAAKREGAYRRDRSALVASGMTYSDVDNMDRGAAAEAAKGAKPLKTPKGSKRIMTKARDGRDRHALLTEAGQHWQADQGGKEWKVTSLSGEDIGTVERYSEAKMHSYGGGSRLGWKGQARTVWEVRGAGVSRARDNYPTRDEALNELFDGREREAARPAPAAASA